MRPRLSLLFAGPRAWKRHYDAYIERQVSRELARRERLRAKSRVYDEQAVFFAELLGVHPLDCVHYETLSEFPSQADMMRSLLHDGTPFRTHPQWCAAVVSEGKRICDCGAEWQAFLGGESGRELVTMSSAG